MIYGYLRISTSKQDAKVQHQSVEQYCNSRNLLPITTIEDEASGTISWRKRELGKLLNKLEPKDQIVFSEVSRIGRTTYETLEFLKVAAEKQVTIHIAKQNMIFDNSLNSKIIATTLALAAEIERDFISARTKEGLQRAKEKGVKLGRPKGSKSINQTCAKAHDDIVTMLKNGVSKSAIARTLKVDRKTLKTYIDNRIKS